MTGAPVDAATAWEVASRVPDPELPVVTIADLGILRDVTVDDRGRAHVQITRRTPAAPPWRPSVTTW